LRELNEELGIVLEDEEKLSFIGKTFYRDDIVSVWSYVYMVEIMSNTTLNFCDGEVASVQWQSKDGIIKMLEYCEKMTPDGKECFLYFIQSETLKQLNKI
jgi:8-oxo-dGTP pyrophosphatase MutT (NUDIX family)